MKTTRMFKFFKIMKDRKCLYVKLYKAQDDDEPLELNNMQGTKESKYTWKTDKDIRLYFRRLDIHELPPQKEIGK